MEKYYKIYPPILLAINLENFISDFCPPNIKSSSQPSSLSSDLGSRADNIEGTLSTFGESTELSEIVFTFVTSVEKGERGEKYIGTLDVNIVYPNVNIIF